MSIIASRIDTWKPKQADYGEADGGVQSTFPGKEHAGPQPP